MKFIRYRQAKAEYRGVLDGDIIKRINGTIFHDYSITDTRIDIKDVEILPPILPSKVIGLRMNYTPLSKPKLPLVFLKTPTSVIGHNDNIIFPDDINTIAIEAELAVVIGKKCRNISENHAENYILGYTISNDITGSNPDFTESFTSGKYYDTFTPLGCYIDSSTSYDNLNIKTYINGTEVQSGNTKDMIYKVPEIVSYLSKMMTLNSGDVILTGTPSRSVEANIGDVIDMDIENLGRLSNKVIKCL